MLVSSFRQPMRLLETWRAYKTLNLMLDIEVWAAQYGARLTR
jgi:hypothetical protein